jgi:hypothetical protein
MSPAPVWRRSPPDTPNWSADLRKADVPAWERPREVDRTQSFRGDGRLIQTHRLRRLEHRSKKIGE